MMHVPMCPVCNENEVGSLPGGTEYYCSSTCNRIAHEEAAEYAEEFRAEYYGEDIMSMYDDDPSPYAGTYSEE
jgi:hypothetical protein